MTNLQEYLTCTVPTDPNSVFQLHILAGYVGVTNAVVTWPVVHGKSYRLEFKNDLADPVWANVTTGVSFIGT